MRYSVDKERQYFQENDDDSKQTKLFIDYGDFFSRKTVYVGRVKDESYKKKLN